MEHTSGLLLVDKPGRVTSHDVVAAVRRASHQRRVGHAGTLDPLATGLLLVCLGQATRICEYLVGHDKTYAVEVRLGQETDTYDAEGAVRAHWTGPLPGDGEVAAVLSAFVGEIVQAPPPFSAIKVAGKPLYWYARRGSVARVQPRRVKVYSLTWDRPARDTLRLTVLCSSGTYVRSLVHDLGCRLGCGAHVAGLRRLGVGPFRLEQAYALDEALTRLSSGDVTVLVGIGEALRHMPTISFARDAAARLCHGRQALGPAAGHPGPHLAFDEAGGLIAIIEPLPEPGMWVPRKVLLTEISSCPAT